MKNKEKRLFQARISEDAWKNFIIYHAKLQIKNPTKKLDKGDAIEKLLKDCLEFL